MICNKDYFSAFLFYHCHCFRSKACSAIEIKRKRHTIALIFFSFASLDQIKIKNKNILQFLLFNIYYQNTSVVVVFAGTENDDIAFL